MAPSLAACLSPGNAPALQVALLGAEGTGKTQLAAELMATLGGGPIKQAALLIADNPLLAAVLPTAAAGQTGQSSFDRVLLMGLDLPASGTDGSAQEAADQRLRQALTKADVPYTVIYGVGPARLVNALRALHGLLNCSNPELLPAARSKEKSKWVWACDTCSDPQCERRLLSDLLASRAP